MAFATVHPCLCAHREQYQSTSNSNRTNEFATLVKACYDFLVPFDKNWTKRISSLLRGSGYVKKGLLLEPTDIWGDSAILLCGSLLLHRDLIDNSIMRGSGLTVLRCPESNEEVIRLLAQVNASLFVARQSFVEQLSESVILQITKFGKGCHILAILDSDSIDAMSASKMLRLGCRGVLPRRFSSKLFARAALALIRGEIWAPPKVVSELLSDLLKAVTLKVQSGLTPQEARILELSSQGYKNSAIADALFISLETVRWHKRRLNRKLRGSRHPQPAPAPPREMAG